MSDPTTDTLRRTMQAIVATAPEAPDIATELERESARRPRPVLVMAGAFALVILVGAVTSLVLLGNDRGAVPSGGGDGVAVTTDFAISGPIAYDPLPATWDAVVVVDADALDQDSGVIGGFVEQIGALPGVEAVAVVSPADLAAALGWEDGMGGGVFIMTGGDASAAELAALQAPDEWKIVLSPQSALAMAEQRMERLSRYSEPITDQLSLGVFSGPEPAFDTAGFGDEMPLINAYDGADALPVVPDVFGDLSDAIVYIGSIGGVDGFVYGVNTDGGTTEVCQSASWPRSDAAMTACFTLDEPGLSKSIGMADSAADGIAINVTALSDEVSIVAIELPSGQRYWQRPVAGSAMFVTTEPGVLAGVTIATYDDSRAVLATDQFNPNS